MSSPAELSELPRESSAISTPRPPSSGFPELAKYELLEEIGHGGMATVYRARDPRLGREVAVKVIHKHLRENAEVGLRFIAEARAAAKLRHPNIVEVFDVSTEDDRERYLVAELIRGCTLRKVLVEHREMPAEVGAAITLELCEAVEHAHEASIVHRDIKPENVLVELPSDRSAVPDRESPSAKRKGSADVGVIIKLTDFGIAKLLDVQGVTSTGQVLGSPAHMAPEQIEGTAVDARTDLFAAGTVLYLLLAARFPFEKSATPGWFLTRAIEDPPELREHAPDASVQSFARAIDLALAGSEPDPALVLSLNATAYKPPETDRQSEPVNNEPSKDAPKPGRAPGARSFLDEAGCSSLDKPFARRDLLTRHHVRPPQVAETFALLQPESQDSAAPLPVRLAEGVAALPALLQARPFSPPALPPAAPAQPYDQQTLLFI